MSSKIYIKADSNNWTGRTTAPDLGPQYWYQAIQCADLNEENIQGDIAILGYACDEGVKRNLGRIGAKEGPKSLRNKLGKVALHTSKKLLDVGDVTCIDGDLSACQAEFSNRITQLLDKNIFPIAIGGGHDIAYAHFNGISQSTKGKVKHIGIINFDAHFDLRPIVSTPNSGTPFNQILTESKDHSRTVDYLPIGIQSQANTKELFDIADQEGVAYIYNYDCDFSKIKDQLEDFIQRNDAIYISIDVDGFSSAYAPGVSAPSPLGFTPMFVMECLQLLLASKKVVSCDFAELSPTYDIDNQTANLVARLVDFIVRHQ